MKEKKIAREERNQEKLANGDWVMAEFYATWCPHCQRMKPVVEGFYAGMSLSGILLICIKKSRKYSPVRYFLLFFIFIAFC